MCRESIPCNCLKYKDTLDLNYSTQNSAYLMSLLFSQNCDEQCNVKDMTAVHRTAVGSNVEKVIPKTLDVRLIKFG